MADTEPASEGVAPVRLVLVDDHEMVIEGLKAMLAAFKDRVQVVGHAVGAERATGVVEDLRPDVVLCDVRMQGQSGLDLCLVLRERNPDLKVVMLSVYDDEQYLFQALRVGARGYLLKSIGSKLVIGEETVKSHLRAIYRKLGVSDRTGAVATALREGIYQ